VPKHVEVVPRFHDRLAVLILCAGVHDQAALDLNGLPVALVVVRLSTLPRPFGKTRLSSPTGQLSRPLLEGIKDNRGEGDIAFACL
jgi:hypothetical protein